MNENILRYVKETLDFQYIADVDEFDSLTRDQQHQTIISHINDRMVNIVHSLYEARGNDDATDMWTHLACEMSRADLVFKEVGDYVGYRQLYMDRYHPKHAEKSSLSEKIKDLGGEKELVKMGLMSEDRRWVLIALRLNEKFAFYNDQEIEGVLKMYWDWNMVENPTNERWEEFCKSYGGASNSGPTIDEWTPSHVSDEFTNLDGYISLPKHLTESEKLSRCLTAWSEAFHKWLCELDADIKAWCDAQPEILSYEPPFIWGDRFYSTDSSSGVQVQISVKPKISLAKLILLEKKS